METSTIYPQPPGSAGLVWRRIDSDDAPALVELASACFVADGGLHFLFEPGPIVGRFFHCAAGPAIGAFAIDGRLVACAAAHCEVGLNTQVVVAVGHVHPEARNQGLGDYLMRWSKEQCRSLLAGVPSDQRILQVRTESLTESAHRLYLTHDFVQVSESLVMKRDLHGASLGLDLPAGVTLTSWRRDLAGPFFQAYDAAFRERPGFPGWTTTEWVESWTTDNFMPEWSLLARAGDIPAGFLTAASYPPHGFVVQVGVIPSLRRRGIASALITGTMHRMKLAGAVSAQLTVHMNNPGAIKTYEQLGFAGIARRARYECLVTR